MDPINFPLSAGVMLQGLAYLALMGWNLYAQSEKRSLQKDISELKRQADRAQSKLELVEKAYYSREDHKEFRHEVLGLFDKMGATFNASLEKLSNKLERFIEERHKTQD